MSGQSGSRALRRWSSALRAVSAEPVSEATRRSVGAYLVSAAQLRARAGLGPGGHPLAPLSPATIRRKGHARFWLASGASLASVRSRVTRSGVVVIIETPHSGAVHGGRGRRPRGSSATRRRRDQRGGRRVPPRPILGLSAEDAAVVARLVARDVLRRLKGGQRR